MRHFGLCNALYSIVSTANNNVLYNLKWQGKIDYVVLELGTIY